MLHSFPPASRGGTESYVEQLAQTQREESIQVTIFAGTERGHPSTEPDPSRSRTDEPVWAEEFIGGLRVLRLRPWLRDLDHAVRNSDLGENFVEMMRHEKFDLLHIHHWHNTTSDLVARATMAGIPTVVTLHDFHAICPWSFRMRDDKICATDVARETCIECVAERIGDSRSDVKIILREREGVFRTELEHAGALLTLSASQMRYLQQVPSLSGLEFKLLSLPRPELRPHPSCRREGDILRIVSWGGLVAGKGMQVLLDACELLSEPVELHHYGRVIDFDFSERLRGTARQTRLTLHGTFDTAVMQREFPCYDLAVFPSLFLETHGFVIDEAMLLGLPVVTSDRGAPVERIGDRGVSFPGGDTKALTTVIEGFLAEPTALDALRNAAMPPAKSMADHWSELRAVYDCVLKTV
ncbi:MAG: glycosyltransferase [Planctomycetota bacterium]|nr:glycosyltransferase [Planctomycetota bacterium]